MPIGPTALLLALPLGHLPIAPPPPSKPVVVESSPLLRTANKAAAQGHYRITPERRSLLNTIRYAEGTWIGGSQEGYRVLYGGGRFASLERHPEITVRKRYTSAAAGAYQFLPGTWKRTARRINLSNFSPASQDQAALHLVKQRGALDHFDRQGLNAEVLAKLAPEWASLPAHHGGSYYGQPVKSLSELQSFYRRELRRQRSKVSA